MPLTDSPATPKGRIPELDGLRGIAVLLVLLAHMAHGVYPLDRPFVNGVTWNGGGGGLAGVQLFFGLSGYLITSILLNEYAANGRISLRHFYLRRVRRLVPALVVIAAAYGIIAAAAGMQMRPVMGSIFHALTYTTNIRGIIPLPDTKYLEHTWSLAVEEQFYLFWPCSLVVLMPVIGRHKLAKVALAGAIVTVILRHVGEAYLSAGRAAYVNYELLRWDALLLGCWLALTKYRFPRWSLYPALGCVTVLLFWLPAPIAPEWFTATSLASVILVSLAPNIRLLSNAVLRHIGGISYGLYLWHIFVLRFGFPGPVSLALSFLAAELSYIYVERRFLSPPGKSRAAAPQPLLNLQPTDR